MELECGGSKGGQTRVTKLDTADGEACPGDWINNANYNSLCTGTGGAGCFSANFTVPYSYNKICGQVRGFQKGSPDGFYPYLSAKNSTPTDLYSPLSSSTDVNGVYVDGISITLGEPRKHVWTYAIGLMMVLLMTIHTDLGIFIALVLKQLRQELLHLLAIITTVNLAMQMEYLIIGFSLKIHCGMVNNAFLVIVAVIELDSHGFSINYLSV